MKDFAPINQGSRTEVAIRPTGLTSPANLRQNQALNLACFFLAWLAAFWAPAQDSHSIINSKHNLSASGPGEVRSPTEADMCVFCHTPHNPKGQPALWNQRMSAAAYTPYSSSTLQAKVGQPTGSSKLCLSCHDGTVAVGMVASQATPIPMRTGTGIMPKGRSQLGTDLSGHHPISFTYDSALATAQGELRDPSTLQPEVRLDREQQLQCVSCHDPHNNQYGKFLVKDNTASALCLSCHTPTDWSTSAHATSQATWNGTGRNPWPNASGKTVAANGCENCHTTHDAGTKTHLLTFPKAEDNCLVCHDGSVAAKNVASEFNKPSAHPITGLAITRDMTASPLHGGDSHVSCSDCHNPHALRTSGAGVVAGPASLARVKGVNAEGSFVSTATHEYELCFRCHASATPVARSPVPRQFPQPNTRLEFNPANVSYHPVLNAARSASDRTLVSPWSAASQMTCGDCHNNDQGPGSQGVGPRGPHGSRYAPLLERNLVQVDFQAESFNAYALCYKCHSQGAVLADALHSRHVRDFRTACSTCHDAHGVENQSHLINFNTLYVTALNGQMSYNSLGGGGANCTLSCHGKSHDRLRYP